MTTYYVDWENGDDGNAGTHETSSPWLTVDKALSTMTAGDDCHIKPGFYPELVTVDNAGSSGNPITINGDFAGAIWGVIGPVIISAHDDMNSVAVRASCLDMNGKNYIIWNKVQFHGGTSFAVGNTAYGSATAYEGCEFNDCLFQASGTSYSFRVEVNAGTTPTGSGLTMRRCQFIGKAKIDWDSNGSAHVNLKWSFDRCFSTSLNDNFNITRITNGGAYTIGGVVFDNCMLFTGAGINCTYLANTNNPFEINNCRFVLSSSTIYNVLGSVGALIERNGIISGYATGIFSTDVNSNGDMDRQQANLLIGGLHDMLYYQLFGWSPFKPWEPMAVNGIADPAIDYGWLGVSSDDVYGNPAMGTVTRYGHTYYFDGSDDAVSDPNSVWTNESHITNDSISDAGANCSTTGSTSSNYVTAGGTTAPASGGTIANVYVRVLSRIAFTSGTADIAIYTDAFGELLTTHAMNPGSTLAWTSWEAITAPSGGWTWAKIQALEFKAYRSTGTGTVYLAHVQIYVDTGEVAPDVGPVEARTRPVKETTTYYGGSAAMNFRGTGFYEALRAVDAVSTTISVQARKDANYSGDAPKLLVSNIDGVADQSDTLSVAAGNWEQLSVTFTPTAAGWVRVQLWGYDVSDDGYCFFDDLAVS